VLNRKKTKLTLSSSGGTHAARGLKVTLKASRYYRFSCGQLSREDLSIFSKVPSKDSSPPVAHSVQMFCPKCRSLMISSGGQMKCRKCGFLREFSEHDSLQLTRSRGQREITIIDDAEKVATLPTMTIRCPTCGHNLAFWWLRQLRAADESEVRFFRCCKCEHTWRQYD